MARDSFDNKDELDVPVQRDNLGNALVIVTTVILLVAFFLMEKTLKEKYNGGMMSDATAGATK